MYWQIHPNNNISTGSDRRNSHILIFYLYCGAWSRIRTRLQCTAAYAWISPKFVLRTPGEGMWICRPENSCGTVQPAPHCGPSGDHVEPTHAQETRHSIVFSLLFREGLMLPLCLQECKEFADTDISLQPLTPTGKSNKCRSLGHPLCIHLSIACEWSRVRN